MTMAHDEDCIPRRSCIIKSLPYVIPRHRPVVLLLLAEAGVQSKLLICAHAPELGNAPLLVAAVERVNDL